MQLISWFFFSLKSDFVYDIYNEFLTFEWWLHQDKKLEHLGISSAKLICTAETGITIYCQLKCFKNVSAIFSSRPEVWRVEVSLVYLIQWLSLCFPLKEQNTFVSVTHRGVLAGIQSRYLKRKMSTPLYCSRIFFGIIIEKHF